MPRVWIVPGFLGSELSADPQGRTEYWVNYTVLFEAGLDPMRLNPAGTGPGSPGGVQLYATGILPPYWVRAVEVLGRDLGRLGWIQRLFPWDWRLDLTTTGRLLAADIQAHASAEDPATLVCHSTGGLVARVAWAVLLAQGQQSLIRRIVNLSTPDHGTYAAPAAWCQVGDYWSGLAKLAQIYGTAWPLVQPISPPDFSPVHLIAIMQTWPSMYQLLPLLDVEDEPPDPKRREIYDAQNWPSAVRPSELHLATSAGSWGTFLRSVASQPPSWVTTNVWSSGYGTPAVLASPSSLGSPAAIGLSADGDGVVTRTSSLGSPGASIQVTAGHEDMPRATAESGVLVAAILDPRGPLDPPPPPAVVPGINVSTYTAPPIAGYVAGGSPADPCWPRVCRC